MRRAAPALCLVLAACGADADYPALMPLDQLLAEPAPAATTPAAVQADLSTRAAALSARAQTLRGPVIDPATRARMSAAQARAR